MKVIRIVISLKQSIYILGLGPKKCKCNKILPHQQQPDCWLGCWGLPDCWIARLLDCQIAGLPDCWIVRLPDCQDCDCWIAVDCRIARFTRLPDCQIARIARLLPRRFYFAGLGLPVCWFAPKLKQQQQTSIIKKDLLQQLYINIYIKLK